MSQQPAGSTNSTDNSTNRSVGIAQGLLDLWSTTIDQLPQELTDILSEVGLEAEFIPPDGIEPDGDSVHHLFEQVYEDALEELFEDQSLTPPVRALIDRLLTPARPGLLNDALNELIQLVNNTETRSTAIAVLRIIHPRARQLYLTFKLEEWGIVINDAPRELPQQ